MKRTLLDQTDQNGMDSECQNRIASLLSRISNLEGGAPTTLAARMSAAESGLSSHGARLTELESGTSSFTAWKNAKPAALSKLNFTVSGIGLTVLGLTVAGADKVKQLADKVDALIDLQTARSVTA